MTRFFAGATTWADVKVSVDRVVAICFPHHYSRWRRNNQAAVILILCIWSVMAIDVALILCRVGGEYTHCLDGTCYYRAFSTYAIIHNLLLYIYIALYGGLTVTSSIIFLTVWVRRRRQNTVHNLALPQQARRQRLLLNKRLAIAKASFASLIWGLIFLLPYTIHNMSAPQLAATRPALTKWLTFCFYFIYVMNLVMRLCTAN